MNSSAEYQSSGHPQSQLSGAQLESSTIRKVHNDQADLDLFHFQYLNKRPSRLRTHAHLLDYLDNSFQHVVATIPFYGTSTSTLLDLNFSIPSNNCCAWEVWVPAENSAELMLGESIYFGLDHFAYVSSQTRFLYGIGLPGQVWKTRQPVIMSNLPGRQDFLRADMANRFGLNLGIGIPISGPQSELLAVLVCLLDSFEEFTRRLEVWSVEKNGELSCVERIGSTDRNTQDRDLEMLEETVAQKRPMTHSQLSVGKTMQRSGLRGSFSVTIPTFNDNKVNSVIFISK